MSRQGAGICADVGASRLLLYSASRSPGMMPITITIEPLAPSSERSAGAGGGTSTARVGIVAAPGLAASEAPDLIEPVVGFRSWRIFRDGPGRGELSPPPVSGAWQEPVMRAECRRFRRAEELLEAPHAAPAP